MSNRFDAIYAANEWRYGSGEGSLPCYNREYVALLERFISERGVKSVVDMGCGDWQFSKVVDWRGASYQGFDVAAAVVTRNQSLYSKPGVSFHHYSGDPKELPAADLLIAKDVLQHLPDETVHAFLEVVPRYKLALVTNCVNPDGVTVNRDIEAGSFRFLDIR